MAIGRGAYVPDHGGRTSMSTGVQIERLERSVEQAVGRLERSQRQAIQQALAETLTQFRASLPIARSGTSREVSRASAQDREAIIARIRYAKDVEEKSSKQIANELNTEGIATFQVVAPGRRRTSAASIKEGKRLKQERKDGVVPMSQSSVKSDSGEERL